MERYFVGLTTGASVCVIFTGGVFLKLSNKEMLKMTRDNIQLWTWDSSLCHVGSLSEKSVLETNCYCWVTKIMQR